MSADRAGPHPLLVPSIAAFQAAPPFMISGVAVTLPAIGADLEASANALGLMQTLFLGGSVAMLLPAGRLADAGDKASLYKLGLLAFGLSSLAVAFASSVTLILALRFLQGVTSALFQVAGPALLADLVPPQRRGRVFGMMLGSLYAGLTLGPIVAGFLIDAWGWRAVFLAGAALIIAVYALTWLVLPSKWRSPSPKAVHLPSSALIGAGTLALVLGASSLQAGAWGYAAMAAGLACVALFVRWQRSLERPLLDIEVLGSNRVLRNALLAQWLLYGNTFSSGFVLSIFMQLNLGEPARLSGQVLATGTVIMAIVAPFAGRLADRYPPRIVAGCGVALVLASAVSALPLDAHSSLAHVATTLALQGLGFALFSSPNMTQIMNSVPRERVSIAAALTANARSLGMLTGMFVSAVLVSLFIGSAPVHAAPQRFIAIMQATFGVLVLLNLAALAVSVAGRRRGTPGPR